MQEVSRPPACHMTSNSNRKTRLSIPRLLLGALVGLVGIFLATSITYAALQEIMEGDFFGVGVTAMVVVFGFQVLAFGARIVTGKKQLQPLHNCGVAAQSLGAATYPTRWGAMSTNPYNRWQEPGGSG